jgi:integrase
MPITETQIKKADVQPKRYKMSDGNGLFIEVRPTGDKAFIKEWKFSGKRKSRMLGLYPELKLAAAREQANAITALVKRGIDPTEGDAPAPVEVSTGVVPDERKWSTLCEMFIAKRVAEGIADATENKLRWNLGESCKEFGERDVGSITAPEVLALVERFQDLGYFEKAKDIHRKIAQVMDYSVARGLMAHNPSLSVRRAMVNKKGGRHPGLTKPEDVGALMRAIRGFRGEATTRAGLLLSAYTFLRSGELRPARWREINLTERLWTVPQVRMKGQYGDHLVPLSDQAVATLEWLAGCTNRGPDSFLFPCSYDLSRYMSNATLNAALRRLGYNTRTEHCHHGFRTTFSTNMNEEGWNRDWIERQLCHIDRDEVRLAYNKAEYLPGRTEMMQAYSDWLDKQERRGIQ